MTIQIRETGALRFPALSMRGSAASSVDFDALEAEVIAAREGSASLDAKLDLMETATTTVANEVIAARNGEVSLDAYLEIQENSLQVVVAEVTTARSGEASLDARIDSIATTATGAATAVEFDALQAEIIAAREGQASLDAKLDLMEAATATVTSEVTTARSGKASLDDRIDDVVMDTTLAAATKSVLVGSDDFPISDSENSNIIKRLPWTSLITNIQTALGLNIILGSAIKSTLAGSDDFPISDSEDAIPNSTKRVSWSTMLASIGTGIGPAIIGFMTVKSTIATVDDFVIADGEDASLNASKRVSWGTMLVGIRNALGTSLIAGLTAKTTIAAGDDFPISDSEDTNASKKVSWAVLKAAVDVDSASQAEFDALEAEVVAARSGKASLDARIDLVVQDAINAAPDQPAIPPNARVTFTDSGDSYLLKHATFGALKTIIYDGLAPIIATSTLKTTLDDADDFIVADEAAANVRKRINWGNLKANISGWLGPLAPQADFDTLADAVASAAWERPGDVPELFSHTLIGEAASRPPVDAAGVIVDTHLGAAYKVTGGAPAYVDIGRRADFAIEPGRRYRVRATIKRLVNSADPLNNGVELRVENLTQAKAHLSNEPLGGPLSPVVANSVLAFSFLIGKDTADTTLDYVVPQPAQTTYLTPHLRLYGNDHQTAIGVIDLDDVTDHYTAGPDFDANGPLADRDLYDAELDGFTFLATDDLENPEWYIRTGDTSGVWSGPFPLRPEPGDTIAYAVSIMFESLAEANAVAANYPENTGAEIYGGVDDPENGIYRRVGGAGTESWEFVRPSGATETDTRLDALEDLTDGITEPTEASIDLKGFHIESVDNSVTESGSLHQITVTDANGDLREVFGIDATNGLIKGMLRGDYLAANEVRADIDPAEVYARGGRGTVRKVRDRGDKYLYYQTDQLGGAIRDFKTLKVSGPGNANILDTSDTIAIVGSQGQSWATNSFWHLNLFGDSERESVLTLHISNAAAAERDGPLPAGAGINIGGTIDDITGCDGHHLFSIGRMSVVARQRLRRRHGVRETPIAEFTSAYPSSSWTTGTGNGLGLGPNGTTWPLMLQMQGEFNTRLPNDYGLEPVYTSILWTQAGHSSGDSHSGTIADLTDMVLQNDLLDLPGTDERPLNYYISQVAPGDSETDATENYQAMLDFCRGIEPRAYSAGPWYAFAFRDNIHIDGPATARFSERVGWAMFAVEDLGIPWVPVCRSRAPIKVSGQSVTVPMTVPRLRKFRTKQLVWRVGADAASIFDGVPPLAPNYGWHVRRGGIELTLSNVGLAARHAKAATTANITLSGAQTIDGIACSPGDMVLVKSQTPNKFENGLYIVQSGAWTRAPEMAVWEDFPETVIKVVNGTFPDQSWVCTVAHGGTLGVTTVWWQLMNTFDDYLRCVTFDVAETLSPGDVLEVSYAWHGPGANDEFRSGVWGNLALEGEPSVFFPGETADHWCCHFRETITL